MYSKKARKAKRSLHQTNKRTHFANLNKAIQKWTTKSNAIRYYFSSLMVKKEVDILTDKMLQESIGKETIK